MTAITLRIVKRNLADYEVMPWLAGGCCLCGELLIGKYNRTQTRFVGSEAVCLGCGAIDEWDADDDGAWVEEKPWCDDPVLIVETIYRYGKTVDWWQNLMDENSDVQWVIEDPMRVH